MLRTIYSIAKREVKGYFGSPVAYVFIFFFLILCGLFTFYVSKFYEARQADLRAFFVWHPWLYLFLVPAVGMRLWAEERKSGTIEILLTLPVTIGQAVIAKFLAAWLVLGISLILTFPLVITVYYLGSPDTGAILAGYLGSFIMAGAYLAIGGLMSSATKNQVIAFILAVVVSFVLVMAGWPPITDMLAKTFPKLVPMVAYTGFVTHFDSIQRGVLDSRDFIYFGSIIVLALCATAAVLNTRRAA